MPRESHAVTDAIFGEIVATFDEDKVVIEAQQKRAVSGRRQLGILSDAGGVQARRVIAERLAAEAEFRSDMAASRAI